MSEGEGTSFHYESVHFYAGFVFWKLARNSGRATSMLMMIQAYCSSFEALIVAQLKSFWRLGTYMPCLLFHACLAFCMKFLFMFHAFCTLLRDAFPIKVHKHETCTRHWQIRHNLS